MRLAFTSSKQKKRYHIPVRFVRRGSKRKWSFPDFCIFHFDMTCGKDAIFMFMEDESYAIKKQCSHVWILIDWDLALPVSLLILCQLRQHWDSVSWHLKSPFFHVGQSERDYTTKRLTELRWTQTAVIIWPCFLLNFQPNTSKPVFRSCILFMMPF